MTSDRALSLRAFFAVTLAEAARTRLTRAAEAMKKESWAERVRWTEPEKLHLTLRFLGEVPLGDVDPLVSRVEAATRPHRAFEMALRGLLLFPNRRRPRVIAAGIAPCAALEALVAAIEQAVVAQGLPASEHAFRAHVTLGRFRGRPGRLPGELPALSPERVPVPGFTLMRSELDPSGARHTALHRFELEAEAAQR